MLMASLYSLGQDDQNDMDMTFCHVMPLASASHDIASIAQTLLPAAGISTGKKYYNISKQSPQHDKCSGVTDCTTGTM